MKPAYSESRLNFQSLLKPAKNRLEKKNLSVATLEYIWPSSIPYNLKHIMTRQKVTEIRIKRTNRSTLKFLEETQKYINRIRNPELTSDCHQMSEVKPRLPQKSDSCKNMLNTKLESFRKGFITKRRLALNQMDTIQSPLSNPSGHKPNKSCSIITLSLRVDNQNISNHS